MEGKVRKINNITYNLRKSILKIENGTFITA